MNRLILADVRPTDVWDLPDALGAAVLVLLVGWILLVVRVRRRR